MSAARSFAVGFFLAGFASGVPSSARAQSPSPSASSSQAAPVPAPPASSPTLAPAPAPGPTSGAVGADPAARAEELIRAGVALRKAKREAEALERFREANAIHPSARALAQMGLAAKSMRLYVEAERYLDGALAAAEDPWVRENREALELARDVVAKQLAWLLVATNVDGAELLVNGAVVGKLPLERPVRVTAGTVLIAVRVIGYAPSQSEATLSAGSTKELRLDLVREQAPRPDLPAPPLQGRAAAPADAPASRRPWIYVAAGVGVVGLGVGTYFGVRALSLGSDRDEACPQNPCPDTPEGRRGAELDADARELAAWSTVGFVVGALGVGVATVLWIAEPRSKKTAARLRAVATPDRAGGSAGAVLSF